MNPGQQKKYQMNRNFNRVIRVWTGLTYFILFFPIAAIVIMSFNTSNYGMLPFNFTTKWYAELFEKSNLLPATWLSLKFSLLVGLTSCIIGTAASLALRKLSPKTNRIFAATMNIPIIIPWLVQSVALLLIFNMIGLGRTYTGMFAGNLIAVMPYSFLLTYASLQAMERSAEEAGKTLGATPFYVFKDITLPMIFPAVLSGGLMAFMVCFNNFVMQYYLAPFGVYTLPMEIFTLIRVGFRPDLNALSSILCVFSILIVLLLYKIGFSAKRMIQQ